MVSCGKVRRYAMICAMEVAEVGGCNTCGAFNCFVNLICSILSVYGAVRVVERCCFSNCLNFGNIFCVRCCTRASYGSVRGGRSINGGGNKEVEGKV